MTRVWYRRRKAESTPQRKVMPDEISSGKTPKRENQAVEEPDDRLILGLFSDLATLRDSLARLYEPSGLNEHKFAVLESLAAQHPEPSLPSLLADSVGITRSGMTDLLDQLEGKGWIERGRDPENRRTVKIRLTVRGLSVIQQARIHFRSVCRDLLSGLDPQEVRRLGSASAALSRVALGVGQKFSIFQPNP